MNKLLKIKGFDKYMLEAGTNKVISFYKDEVNGKIIGASGDGTYRLWRNGEPEHLALERIKYLANAQDKLSEDRYIVARIGNDGSIYTSNSPKVHTKTSAIKEAERLVMINTNEKFGILKLEGVCKAKTVIWE